jgi:putative endonuclease
MRFKYFHVYIMTNKRRGVLYTGFTGGLEARVYEHKHGVFPGFTRRYNLKKLVYYEQFDDPSDGIRREKQIKGWIRAKKIALIESMNPEWKDLSEGWYDTHGGVLH